VAGDTLALRVSPARSLTPRLALAAGLAALAACAVAVAYARHGLFQWPGLGDDYADYYALTVGLRSGDPGSMYRREALRQYMQALVPYTMTPDMPMYASLVPYLPLFAWLFIPFAALSPPAGFALWTVLNGLAGLCLAWRCGNLFPREDRSWVRLALLGSFPLILTVYVGQAQLLLACAVAECYLALRSGRDARAGLWLSLLFFKPTYALLLGPLLIWKHRWAAIATAALGVAVILVGSALVAGLPALLAYPSSYAQMAAFRGDAPTWMINWRSLVLHVFPNISDSSGRMLTLVLGGATVMGAALAWRGPWDPAERDFPGKVVLLLLATLLTNFHSHGYGAVVLAVPIAALLAEQRPGRLGQVAIAVLVVAPTLAFDLLLFVRVDTAVHAAGLLFALASLVCFGCLLGECRPAWMRWAPQWRWRPLFGPPKGV
jgi:hypothetical protein